MIVRRADTGDAAAVGELTHDVYVGEGYANPDDAPGYVAELSDSGSRIAEAVVMVAVADGEIVGTVTAAPAGSALRHIADPDELEVRMLAVRRSARRHGVATALVRACEDLAAELGCSGVVLCTDPAMVAARRLYEGRGYLRAPERDWTADGVPLLSYRRPLPNGPSGRGVAGSTP